MGEKQQMEERGEKSVLTIVSYACECTMCGAHKQPEPEYFTDIPNNIAKVLSKNYMWRQLIASLGTHTNMFQFRYVPIT